MRLISSTCDYKRAELLVDQRREMHLSLHNELLCSEGLWRQDWTAAESEGEGPGSYTCLNFQAKSTLFSILLTSALRKHMQIDNTHLRNINNSTYAQHLEKCCKVPDHKRVQIMTQAAGLCVRVCMRRSISQKQWCSLHV